MPAASPDSRAASRANVRMDNGLLTLRLLSPSICLHLVGCSRSSVSAGPHRQHLLVKLPLCIWKSPDHTSAQVPTTLRGNDDLPEEQVDADGRRNDRSA